MDRRESKFTTEVIKWLRKNWHITCGIEIKVTRGGTFNLREWIKKQPHQIRNLAICGRHFLYKLSDYGQLGGPFDVVSIANSPGYLILQFYKSRVKHFYIIEVSELQKEIDSGAKSLTEDRANAIAYEKGILC